MHFILTNHIAAYTFTYIIYFVQVSKTVFYILNRRNKMHVSRNNCCSLSDFLTLTTAKVSNTFTVNILNHFHTQCNVVVVVVFQTTLTVIEHILGNPGCIHYAPPSQG